MALQTQFAGNSAGTAPEHRLWDQPGARAGSFPLGWMRFDGTAAGKGLLGGWEGRSALSWGAQGVLRGLGVSGSCRQGGDSVSSLLL